MFKLILPDKKTVEVNSDKTYYDVFKENFPQVLKHSLAVKCGAEVLDLNAAVNCSGELKPVTFDSDEGKEVFWHSSAHVLAQAVKRIYPTAQLTFGPVTKHGPGFFYYDISLAQSISMDDLPLIENEMFKIVSEKLPVSRHEYSRKQAIDEFKALGENFKAEIVGDIPGSENITVYKQGEFQDLCRGPHVYNTSALGHFKLTAISGAYFKGDSSKPMLQRIYGVSFPTEKELKSYLHRIEEAKKRDHRLIGKELDLFSFHDEAAGMPFYHSKGTVLFNLLQNYIRGECEKRGYDELRTPVVLSDELWMRSGHYENFKENMYFTKVDERGFAIKPMNCPGATLVYKSHARSYRDLPLKLAEFGLVHRHELSGVLHGLFRVRAFTQDDGHIFCTPDQLPVEVEEIIKFTLEAYQKFGFEKISIFIATRPEKSMGSDDIWQKATSALIDSINKLGLDYKIKDGEGAFYGPKIEFNIEDSLERNWQLGTIQVDFSMPERFELEYTGSDGAKSHPVMIHRAILGSVERFMGILIEHFAGKLPVWLSPIQARVLTVSEGNIDYANHVVKQLKAKNIRIDSDFRNEKIGYKIREFNSQKINYALIIGDKESADQTISVRIRGEQSSPSMSVDQFIEIISKLV
ncbi:MAG: threonine--tRNA ligase [Spirochaetia bacterium]|nr:threonine--tRNA ligase [Spirochaetia bacterium]